ncbi:MAG TPA: adenylyl-sulfate kinase, partial [Terrimicrobiaceae bacterium]
ARANEIPNFTGISSAYEAPEAPDLEVRTDLLSVEDSAALVCEAVNKKLFAMSGNVSSRGWEAPFCQENHPIYLK